MSVGRIGGIVLAGGRSSRFGRDKLSEPIDGRPLLDLAVEAVLAVASDVVVVIAPGARRVVPAGARLAHDTDAFQGPLAGVAVGLAALEPDIERVIVVAGDMPSLAPLVLHRLLTALGPGATAVLLGTADGETPPLPAAYDRRAASIAAEALLAAGERRLRALPARLAAAVIPATDWADDDPTAATLRDIDRVEDL
ncbi:MAG: molybdenum cofactor guanylyltransferase [Candidatus Limnocylindrales bacterium]